MNHTSPTFNLFYSFQPSHLTYEKRDPLADNHFGPHKVSHEYKQVPRGQELTPVRSHSLVRRDFDKMVNLQMPATELQAIYTRLVTDPNDRARFNNLYHEANADVRAIMSCCQHVPDFPFNLTDNIPGDLYQPRRHQRVLVLVDKVCQILGLDNSHDTKATVPDKLLEDNQEGLQRCLQTLAALKRANKKADRVRKDRPPPKTSHRLADKLGKKIGMVFREFSGHSFETFDKPKGRERKYTWRVKPLPNLPVLSQMVRAVTPEAPQPQGSGVGGAMGPLTCGLHDMHLSEDPEVVLNAPEDPEAQADSMM